MVTVLILIHRHKGKYLEKLEISKVEVTGNTILNKASKWKARNR